MVLSDQESGELFAVSTFLNLLLTCVHFVSEFKNTLLLQAENALLVQHIKITGKTLDAEMLAEARGKSADRGALKC